MAAGSQLSLRTLVANSCPPLVFKHAVYEWPSMQWTPEYLSQVLGDKSLDCKISLIQCEEFQWEPDCLHLKITMKQYMDWLQGDTHQDNPLRLFDISKFSCYIDYKYMKDMFKEQPDILKSVRWDVFGLNERNGEHSTIWIGSSGTYTPCHQDTYGFNLVAQIQGRKRWYLFNPDQTDNIYPTRIPYEESSVYSEVNIRYPDLERHPLFHKTSPYVIELVPGDVLYVPSHWWHFVESLEPSISINTWVPVVEDAHSRLDEAVCRLLYTCLSTTLLSETERLAYLNTGEKLEDKTINLQYIQRAVQTLVGSGHPSELDMDKPKKKREEKLSHDNFEKFLNKFQNNTVTVVCLCGVEIDLPESLGRAVASKRKRLYDDENEISKDTPNTEYETKISQKKIKSNMISSDTHKAALPSDAGKDILESPSEVNDKRCKIKLDMIANDDHKNVQDTNNKSITNERSQSTSSPLYADATCDGYKTNLCGIEIFAAKSFSFNEYLRFLKIVFDYESNYKHSDCVVSDWNSQIKLETESSMSLSTSSSTNSSTTASQSSSLSALDLSRLPESSLASNLTVSLPKSVSTYTRSTPSMSTSIYSCTDNYSLGSKCKDVKQNDIPEKEHEGVICSDFKVKTDYEIKESFASNLNDSSETHNVSVNESGSGTELNVNMEDIINSILNPNVIKHIRQILMNKYCK